MYYMENKNGPNVMNTAGGMGAGAVLGALVGGPLGAVVGGALGAILGYATEEQK